MTPGAGDAPAAPAISETHISTVFFTADRAYKVLKPVRTSFLDHTSIEGRLAAVDEEIALNRRLAPDVYLGTADIVENGRTVDRMIVMRRMPADRRLSSLLVSGEYEDCVRAVAKKVAAFHAAQAPVDDGADIAGLDAVAKNWHDNLADLRTVRGRVLDADAFDRVEALADRYLEHRGPLFAARIEQGFVRDGHGDLTAQDIFCASDGPAILDCLAFDRRLRIADVLADVAFLAMDIDRLADVDGSRRFLRWYGEFSNEHHPDSLAHHYIAYRANVRAKVAAIRLQQGDADAAAELQTYHDLCLRHLEHGNVTLTLVGGSPGTGKTTLARALSSPLESMVLSTDDLRKDLAGLGHLDRVFSAANEGIYSPAMTEQTYTELLSRARTLLGLGQSVILDASWNRAGLRDQAAQVASEAGADLIEIRCTLTPDVARRRVAERLAAGTDPSDARPELIEQLSARFEPWPTAIGIDTDAAIEDVLADALGKLSDRHHLIAGGV